MICQRFEDWLDERLRGTSAVRHDELPTELADHARTCGRCAGLWRDWSWLSEVASGRAAPAAPTDLADRVVLALRKPSAPRPARWRSIPVRGLWASAGLAAAIALVLLRPAAVPPETVVQTPAIDLRDPLRDTGAAYLALARSVIEAVELPEPIERPVLPRAGWARPTAAPALLESTGQLVAATKEVGSTRVRPITESAVGAFAFLWDDVKPAPEKPSS